MVEQHLLVAHRDNIVVEHPAIDNRRILLHKHRVARIQLMQAGDRFAGLARLTRRIALRPRLVTGLVLAVNEHLHASATVIASQTVMVCGPFVAKQRNCGSAA